MSARRSAADHTLVLASSCGVSPSASVVRDGLLETLSTRRSHSIVLEAVARLPTIHFVSLSVRVVCTPPFMDREEALIQAEQFSAI